MSGKSVIDSVGKNVARLVGDNRRLRERAERLAASNERLRSENDTLAAELAEVKQRLTVHELAEGFGGGSSDEAGVKIARARVSRLMREVDKCIGLLNREA